VKLGPWIQLTSGGGYEYETGVITGPFTMEGDIAHPLSLVARYVGHTSVPWSVASHSVVVARVLLRLKGPGYAARGLLHDAHEAILGDIPTPFARVLGRNGVNLHKSRAQAALEEFLGVREKFREGFSGEVEHAVEIADRAALHAEKRLLMTPEPRAWEVPEVPPEWLRLAHEYTVKGLKSGAGFGDGACAWFKAEYDSLVLDD
jgi:hypothetical protein